MNILTPITYFSRFLTVLGILHGIRRTMLRLTNRSSLFERRSTSLRLLWVPLSVLAGCLLYAYNRQHRQAPHRRCGTRKIAQWKAKVENRLCHTAGGDGQSHHVRENPGI